MFFFHWRGAEAGSRPAAGHFLLLRQKKLTKEKATRQSESPAGHAAVLAKAGSTQTRCAQTARGPDPLLLRSSLSALTGHAGSGSTTASQGVGPSLRSACRIRPGDADGCIHCAAADVDHHHHRNHHHRNHGLALSGRPSAAAARYPAKQWLPPHPQVPLRPRVRSGAKADQGHALSERSEFAWTPLLRAPQRAPKGTRTAGSPFLSLVSFGEAKESDPQPGGSRPQLHASGKRTSQSPVRYRAGDLSKST